VFRLFLLQEREESMTNLFPVVETTPLIRDLIAKKSPVAIGVSGGKDSDVATFETQAYLKAMGHAGPVLLIHSDLGRNEVYFCNAANCSAFCMMAFIKPPKIRR
jgi:tRNA(Ile)-lysidine synthase TilS/MesJ